ncbi:hypothetical protein WH47_01279 [Habropoda laboriosa]|uniref:Laminin subunit alpha-2 n=1 Tax=Habropoda laboriosa TaxID=597456 RepID=A0A0L7QZA7_9HYME|nr:hypothetical protein WH47_01279 [Habropoda laboriosa]
MKYMLILFLQLLFINVNNAKEITHEDIKDAMLSLVHMMRDNTDKLERHEARERQLGEQLKKAIAVLTKRVSTADAIKLQLTKLDEKVVGIEQLILQVFIIYYDKGKIQQMQKTVDTLEDLENRLEGWFTDIENKVSEVNTRADVTLPPVDSISPVVSKLSDVESTLIERISKTESLLKSEAIKLKEVSNIQSGTTQALLTEIQDIGSRLSNLEVSLEKVKEQSQNIKKKLQDIFTRGINVIENKLVETKDETKDTIGALRMDLANNAEHLNQELNNLEKGQSVMVSMADHVLDTKKRVEYGVHQILLEVGDLVNAQGMNINNTLNQRFDGISNDIMDNQNGALANLTTKMEQEMNQVWRQINVMYQQMTESAKALDKLHKQNEEYVNGTTSTMGGMETKVSEITKRMAEVDKNLNYLLGRLSLVTQEFNEIKAGLGNALDNIKASFKEVQDKTNDLRHPGPHPIPESYKEFNESDNIKPDGKPSPEIVKHIFNPQIN